MEKDNPPPQEGLSPVLYLPHSGGPLPLLGDTGHKALVQFFTDIRCRLGQPKAILVCSAHWEENHATITSGAKPGILYDYYGFPPGSYQIHYPASGAPQLAQTVSSLLSKSGIKASCDDRRGFDHGLYIPLKLIYPEATIPCVQLSLLTDLSPESHIALGKALTPLRKKNILIIGSGMSFHNMQAFFIEDSAGDDRCNVFDRWIVETCSDVNLSSSERERRLVEWKQAPEARYCHPREEHLLPLHVCFGVVFNQPGAAEVVFKDKVMGKQVTSFLWS